MALPMKLFIVLCSLLPVVLPCIYASELFLYDSKRDEIDLSVAEVGEAPAALKYPQNSRDEQKLQKVVLPLLYHFEIFDQPKSFLNGLSR